MSDYEVVHPLGRPIRKTRTRTARRATLDGATIGELSNHKFDSEFTFEIIEQEIRKRFPTVKFVSHEQFGDTYGAHETEVIRGLPGKLGDYRCDFVISGNAG
ncbi:MAG: hypothetical protein GEV05_18390 [Betaproteobacteria bacterium]|nr:hypothetical protein [Betaproteobacteria bacterium]